MIDLPEGVLLRSFNAIEEFKHTNILPCCLVCVQPLGEVAYELNIGVEFCSEEHAQQWLRTHYHPTHIRPLTEGIPTQVTKDVWIYAFRQIGEYPKPTWNSGKWLIWLSAANINRYWKIIKEAVEQGRLGDEAKVSTAASPYVKQGKPYVICVYTYDYQDRDDVMRIRQVLRDLGLKKPIPYKRDEDTSRLRYGKNYEPIYRE
jgi:Domain of unknown function (DUF1917)